MPSLKEQVASWWDRRPCNVRHSDKPIGTRQYFNEVEARKYRVEPHIRAFADFPRWKYQKVLEVGCGIGTDTINFARHGARVTAVDISAESLAIARQRARMFRLEFGSEGSVGFAQADAENLRDHVELPLRERDGYGLVYSFGVLHHTPDPLAALTELRRYTLRHTVVKVMLYHRWSWKVLAVTKLRPWRDDLIRQHAEAQADCPVVYTFSRRSARKLFSAAGLEVTDLRVTHIFSYKIGPYREHRYEKVWYWWLLRILEPVLGWHMLITARRKVDR